VTRDANDNTVPADKSPVQREQWRGGDGLSPQPVITLTDMSDGRRGRDEILYSDDFDAIQEFLQHTDSPMMNLSPSWLCRGGSDPPTVHVFPPVNHSTGHHSSLTAANNKDMSSSIESAAPHAHEVCVCVRAWTVLWFLLDSSSFTHLHCTKAVKQYFSTHGSVATRLR